MIAATTSDMNCKINNKSLKGFFAPFSLKDERSVREKHFQSARKGVLQVDPGWREQERARPGCGAGA
jgi:hypothetical protein